MARPRKRTLWLLAGGAVVLLAVALAVFQPWLLFVSTTVDDALPTASPTASVTSSATPTTSESGSPTVKPSPSPTAPVVLAQGTFISHEHQTSGTAKIIKLADGSRILRLENLSTSNGPQVEVWLSDQPVIEGRDGWFVFKDGNHVSLGAIKGNRGNQNYPIPDSVNLNDYSAVTLWCARFYVSFGAAELKPV
jgi:hypothetical protein